MNYLLFNEFAQQGKARTLAEEEAKKLQPQIGEVELVNSTDLDLKAFFGERNAEDAVILLGGDGTLNYFVNKIEDLKLPCKTYLMPEGTGNDFVNDVKDAVDPKTGMVLLNEYVENLPIIEVKGKTYRFINGIGYGIDGECCVEANRRIAAGEKDINYGNITVSLLLSGKYKAPNATVIIDGGEPMTFKKAYLASAMKGRYYGGGMQIAPTQDRKSGKISFVCIYGKGRFGTLLMFPKLFSGQHLKYKKNVCLKEGSVIEVRFDRPTGLQIDGEVIEGVESYVARVK